MQFALDPYSFQLLPDRGQSPRVALLGPGVQGQRLSHRARFGQDGGGHALWRRSALANTPASFEPALDYVVSKMARFPFDKLAERLATA